jgi:hypothetical protein
MATALDIATDGTSGPEGRERLEMRLRDAPLAEQARQKVVETVHPVWINPPPETSALIRWAADRSPEVADLRPIHLLALMATYPFFADLAAVVGRMLRNDGRIDSTEVRSRLKAQWGDRESIGVATRKCLLTLRAFGVIEGERGSVASVAGCRFKLEGDWARWAVAALLLARNRELIDAATVEAAPEFFFLEIRVPGGAAGPLLERVMSGDGRTTYALQTA